MVVVFIDFFAGLMGRGGGGGGVKQFRYLLAVRECTQDRVVGLDRNVHHLRKAETYFAGKSLNRKHDRRKVCLLYLLLSPERWKIAERTGNRSTRNVQELLFYAFVFILSPPPPPPDGCESTSKNPNAFSQGSTLFHAEKICGDENLI